MTNQPPWLAATLRPSFTAHGPEFDCFDTPSSSSATTTNTFISPSIISVGEPLNAYPGAILVRDPPRERLSGPAAELYNQDIPLLLTRCAGKSGNIQQSFPGTADVYPFLDELSFYQEISQLASKHTRSKSTKMTKKRRSLQSIFVPAFLQAPPSPTSPSFGSVSPTSPSIPYAPRMRSYSSAEPSSSYEGSLRIRSQPSSSVASPRDSPPPDFLLDDDPFADLTSAPIDSSRSATPTPPKPIVDAPIAQPTSLPPKPRSPLTPSSPEVAKLAQVASPPRSSGVLPRDPLPRAMSSGRVQPRAAHQKPAFKPRPSLPSLDTLARMNVVLTKKVRKGRVGAGLPFEPWDNIDNDRSSGDSLSPREPSPISQQQYPLTAASQIPLPLSPISPPTASSTQRIPSAVHTPQAMPPQSLTAASEATTSSFTLNAASSSQTLPSPSSPTATSLSSSTLPSLVSQDSVSLLPSHLPPGLGELDADFFDFSIDFDPSEESQLLSSSSDNNSYLADDSQSELPYTTDTDDTSLDIDDSSYAPSLPSLSRSTSLELSSSSLSRSLSSASRSTSSSSGSAEHEHNTYSHQGPFFTENIPQLPSAESESDLLNSPPNTDYFAFPSYSQYSTSVTDWRNKFGYDLYDPDMAPPPPHNSMISDGMLLERPEMVYQPGTSAETIRASVRSTGSRNRNETVDGSGWGEGQDGSHRGYGLTDHGFGAGNGSGRGNGRSSNGRGASSSGWGRGDDDEDRRDDRRRGTGRSSFSTPSSSEPTSSEDEDSADDYGQPSGSQPRFPASSTNASSDDDDVPLAQRIPTALTAQKTIRRQVREERDQRRKDRAARAEARSRQTTLRPAGAGGPNTQALMSSSQEAALHAAQPLQRQRTQTLPGNAQPFAPEDLTKKLQNVKVADVPSRHRRSPSNHERQSREIPEPPRSARTYKDTFFGNHRMSPPMSPTAQQEPAARSLRPMRSFHRSERRPTDDQRGVPMPADSELKLGRSVTRVRSRTNEEHQAQARTWHTRSFPTQPPPEEPPLPKLPRRSEEHTRRLEARSTRTSVDQERPPRVSSSQQRPPIPAMPAMDSSMVNKSQLIQQRIFIGDMQRFNMVEIGPTTNAGDVIEMVEAQGSLAGWAGNGGWMVWEVAQDFGMERPIRNFELLMDVQSSWNKDKMVNTFVIKLTPFAIPLRRSAIPASSPTYAGYVEWEVKRGKWSKRWLQLREHSLWLSKRDNGRDEILLCSLSNFDAYHMTRLHKSPKPFTFAVKSTDNLSFFENAADYVHVFSCKEEEGKNWMEKILVARSYVLYQERNVLFNPRVAGGNAAAGSLSRSGTRKTTAPRTIQPLVAVPPPYTTNIVHSHDVFEPGSLLSKQP
ncbi:hypothetical protein BDQ12DRAFT_691702 [Crucibulum laeve]|uniref:PH domain-containing protein n=1 Tax=Crucibulum laeve TaxID=68775 RepID=A0A5C3LJG7_9AGAR|nr:hypothetical protein BDQ12DRAFT_691702 [Crucibulum laeve]